MENVVSTFPLLRLPEKAILRTLRIMTYRQKFGISLLSKKTKRLVTSLKLTTLMIHVEVKHSLLIMLLFQNNESFCIEMCPFQVNAPPQNLETPGRIYFHNKDPQEWTNSLSVKQLLDHFKLIFHTLIHTLKFPVDIARFNLESIHQNVKDYKRILLTSGDHEYNRRILSVLKPASISLESRALVNECVPKDILIQNFGFIHVPHGLSVQITLDELLMTNSRVIDMPCRQLSAKDLNKFLKLWVKGSNPRLELMLLGCRGDFQNEDLLKGLKYQDAPRYTVRLFKTSGDKEPKTVCEGWDVWRFDGTRATITAQINLDSVDFKLYVWHDHCVVN